MRSFQLNIVGMDCMHYDGPAMALLVHGIEGYLGILAGHTPLTTLLKPGIISYTINTHPIDFYCEGGILAVKAQQVYVVVDHLVSPEVLDAKQLFISQQNMLQCTDVSHTLQQELALVTAQLATIRRYKKRATPI
jgi:F-type H+-transporting ATPase subunit epsilon